MKAVLPESSAPGAAWRLRLPGRIDTGPARHWLVFLAAGCLLTALARGLVDHRVARYVHEQLGFSRTGRRLVHGPELVIALSVVSVVLLGAWRGFVGRLDGIWRTVLLASLSVCVALTLTSVAKIWFGRIPPTNWYFKQWRPTFAFFPGSFPSGHMTAMGAILPFLWERHGLLVAAWALVAAGACYGLVSQEAHFVSDLMAGATLGISVGYAFLNANRRHAPERRGGERS